MTRLTWVLGGLGLSIVGALAGACGGTGNVSVGAGTCPCTVGNPGLEFTIPCGGSGCVSLNGSETGYTCDSSGAHVDQAACSSSGGGPQDAGSTVSHVVVDSSVPDGHLAPDAIAVTPDAGPACAALTGGTCSGKGCDCTFDESCSFSCDGEEGASVTCNSDSTCNTTCTGGCDVDCVQSTGCTATTGPGGDVNCAQAQSCTGTVGAGGTVTCSQAHACMGTAGAKGTVTCIQVPSCTASVGAEGSVDCTQAGTCNVTCTGSCDVDCSEAESCHVACAPDTDCNVTCTIAAASICPDGITKVCGDTPC